MSFTASAGRLFWLLICAAVIAVVIHGSSFTAERAAPDDLAKHGEYLVHHVAMCIYCHTPRTARGELDRSRLLQGAAVPINAPFPNDQWAFEAPRLAGLPSGWREPDLIEFLRSGGTLKGRQAQPPMPPFRMTKEDAAAVTAYLKALK
jgi:mono/diheme cytochrome c family protein